MFDTKRLERIRATMEHAREVAVAKAAQHKAAGEMDEANLQLRRVVRMEEYSATCQDAIAALTKLQKPASKGITDGKKQSGMVPTTDQSRRIAAIFHRRLDTEWNDREVRAYKKLGAIPEDDLSAVEHYYAANWPPDRDANILRHDLLTFLNNFQGEVGRAIIHRSAKKTRLPDDKDPAGWAEWQKEQGVIYKPYRLAAPWQKTEFRKLSK